jgi:hypothetical protein
VVGKPDDDFAQRNQRICVDAIVNGFSRPFPQEANCLDRSTTIEGVRSTDAFGHGNNQPFPQFLG